MQRIPTKKPTVQKPCIDRADPDFSGLHNKKERQILRSDVQYLVHLQGLEPWAHWLRVSCSTNWARGAYYQDAVSNILITMSRRLPIFTSRFQPTILGTSELNYCVRNGNRWDLTVIVTDHMTGSVYHTVYCLSSVFYCNPTFQSLATTLDCVSQYLLFTQNLLCCLAIEGRAFKTE